MPPDRCGQREESYSSTLSSSQATAVAEQPDNLDQELISLPRMLEHWLDQREELQNQPRRVRELAHLLALAQEEVAKCLLRPDVVSGGSLMESEAVKEMDLYARVGTIRRNRERFEAHFTQTCECSADVKENVHRILSDLNLGKVPLSFGPPARKTPWQLLRENLSLVGRFILRQSKLTPEELAFFSADDESR